LPQLAHLGARDGLRWRSERSGGAGLDLDKYQHASLARDNVDLACAAPPVAIHHVPSAVTQIARRGVFTPTPYLVLCGHTSQRGVQGRPKNCPDSNMWTGRYALGTGDNARLRQAA